MLIQMTHQFLEINYLEGNKHYLNPIFQMKHTSLVLDLQNINPYNLQS